MFCLSNTKVGYDWESVLRTYKEHCAPNNRVLEIGAAAIGHTKQLAEHCKELIAVDLLPERISEDFANVTYKIADWQNLSDVIESESVDIAVATHVIEHIPDDLKAVNELYSVLKKGGIAILNTPNRKRLTRIIIEMFTGKKKFPHREHIREYIESDIMELLKKSLFEIYKIFPIALGIHGGPVYVYSKSVPEIFRKYCNFWQIHLIKK